MDKGYYFMCGKYPLKVSAKVAIHNKNGQGLLHTIHSTPLCYSWSQSTIKMDKGYYYMLQECEIKCMKSQSTIKMDKGYYHIDRAMSVERKANVAIHNKNGQGLLHELLPASGSFIISRNPQ